MIPMKTVHVLLLASAILSAGLVVGAGLVVALGTQVQARRENQEKNLRHYHLVHTMEHCAESVAKSGTTLNPEYTKLIIACWKEETKKLDAPAPLFD